MTTSEMPPPPVRNLGDPAQLPPIHLLETEYEILSDIVCASAAPSPGIELLWRELQRAVILPTDVPPRGLVCLHSRVSYTDLLAPRARTVDVVGPAEPFTHRAALSVATPVGAALIGLQVGDRFSWASERGMQAVRVDRVEADPGLAGRRLKDRLRARRRLIDDLLSAN